jgi:hypothetical protein
MNGKTKRNGLSHPVLRDPVRAVLSVEIAKDSSITTESGHREIVITFKRREWRITSRFPPETFSATS